MQGGIPPCLQLFPPDDGHIVAQNMQIDKYTKNTFVHQVRFIYKFLALFSYTNLDFNHSLNTRTTI